MAISASSLIFACADDTPTEPGTDEVGDGDGDDPGTGDGDGDTETGDGDGEPEPTGDGDGDTETGDGDGEPEPTGDGDGDGEPSEDCQAAAEVLAAEYDHADKGCTTIIRFDYETLDPKAWTSNCAELPESPLSQDEALKLSGCCSDGTLLQPDNEDIFMIYAEPDPMGGISVVSNFLATLVFEGTIATMEPGQIAVPETWAEPNLLGTGCAAAMPEGVGFDLTMAGAEIETTQLDGVMEAFADTALTQAIEQTAQIRRTATLLYPPQVDPLDASLAEYVMIIESGAE